MVRWNHGILQSARARLVFQWSQHLSERALPSAITATTSASATTRVHKHLPGLVRPELQQRVPGRWPRLHRSSGVSRAPHSNVPSRLRLRRLRPSAATAGTSSVATSTTSATISTVLATATTTTTTTTTTDGAVLHRILRQWRGTGTSYRTSHSTGDDHRLRLRRQRRCHLLMDSPHAHPPLPLTSTAACAPALLRHPSPSPASVAGIDRRPPPHGRHNWGDSAHY